MRELITAHAGEYADDRTQRRGQRARDDHRDAAPPLQQRLDVVPALRAIPDPAAVPGEEMLAHGAANSQRRFPSEASEPASTAATPIGSGKPIAPSSSVSASAG